MHTPRISTLILAALLIAAFAAIMWPVHGTNRESPARAKPGQSVQEQKRRDREVEIARSDRWMEQRKADFAPVEGQMARGDVAGTRRAYAAYLAQDPTGEREKYQPDIVRIARFYMAESDEADAKAELDKIVPPWLEQRGPVQPFGQAFKPGAAAIEPEPLLMWLASSQVPTHRRQAILDDWAMRWRSMYRVAGALTSSEALAQWEAGHRLDDHGLSQAEKRVAVGYFRDAVRLAPDFLQGRTAYADALARAGRWREAIQAAIAAAPLFKSKEKAMTFAQRFANGNSAEYDEIRRRIGIKTVIGPAVASHDPEEFKRQFPDIAKRLAPGWEDAMRRGQPAKAPR